MATQHHYARPAEDWRVKPAYSVRQAAWLAETTTATVRRWLQGYDQPGHKMRPVFGERNNDPYLSFLELAEVVVAASFRRKRLTLERIRRARQFAADLFDLEYPFATLKMKNFGVHMATEFERSEPGEPLLVLDLQGQLTLPGLVGERLEEFDWLSEWACRWFPLGKNIPIVIDPQMGGGRPTVEDRGITVETIMRRFLLGNESIPSIAKDYDLKQSSVTDIIRYATRHQRLLAA